MYDNLLPFHGVPYFLYTKTETGCEICKGHHDCVAQGPGCCPGSFIWFSTCRGVLYVGPGGPEQRGSGWTQSSHSGSSLGPAPGADGLASGPVTGSDQQTF